MRSKATFKCGLCGHATEQNDPTIVRQEWFILHCPSCDKQARHWRSGRPRRKVDSWSLEDDNYFHWHDEWD